MSVKRSGTVEELKRERVLSLAAGEGIKYGAGAVAVVGSGTVLATHRIPAFAKYMSLSAKVSLPVMAGLFMFTLKFEHAISSCNRFPERWGLSEENIKRNIVTRIPIHHRVANALYDNPFSLIVALGAPFAGVVLSRQMAMKHLTISQRVMHSRVFAQAGILVIGLSTLAFRDYMNKRGRFPEPNDHAPLDA